MSRVFDESFEYLRSRAWGTSTYDCASVTGVLDGWLANIAGYDDYLRWLKRHIDEKRKAIASRPQRRTFIKRLEEWVSFFAESKNLATRKCQALRSGNMMILGFSEEN